MLPTATSCSDPKRVKACSEPYLKQVASPSIASSILAPIVRWLARCRAWLNRALCSRLNKRARQSLGSLDRDDGLLTADEIKGLRLDADWVALSPCSTAGGSREDADTLSDLAVAFFHAGARALLIPYWGVGFEATVKLTTEAFAELNANPRIGQAEAMRNSMRDLLMHGSLLEAHPSQWAPFVIVGNGAAPN